MKKAYNKPDLNAPRYKPTRLAGAGIKFYTKFYKKHPEYKHLHKSDIKKILVAYNINMRSAIVNERDGVEFPEKLGYSFVGSCPPAIKSNPNRASSLEHGVSIENTNANSDGLVAKIFYSNYSERYTFKMRELWTFKPNRYFTRAVSQAYRVNWKSYIQVDNFTRIKKLYDKIRQRNYAIAHTEIPGSDYNEFDLS
jgi:hypothetical protein